MADHDIRRLTANEAAALDEAAAQRARAEAAEVEAERLRRANKTIIGENHDVRAQLDQARGALLAGDWPGLRYRLGISATERLPAAHVPLDTAPGFNAGEPLDIELSTSGLTAEQEIRSWALDAAVRLTPLTAEQALRWAATFAAYIRDGRSTAEASDA